MPRVESQLIMVGDRLFIFGGKCDRFSGDNYFHSSHNNINWPWINSYSVARLHNNQWIWEARDQLLPPDVRARGVCNAAAAMADGNRILLTFSPIRFDNSAIDMEVHTSYRLKARSFVVYNIAVQTFTIPAESRGTFPGETSWHVLYGLPGRKDASPSAIVCNFRKDPARRPELFIYSLRPQPSCKSLALRQRIAATTGIVFELFVVVGSKMFLFG
ncbi:hypothetical protein B0H19DRAFT_201291 [Mycena capillaripes]|nr:hypothetical protein B0H19DRAFT_201291 [Mycena capillaripes]